MDSISKSGLTSSASSTSFFEINADNSLTLDGSVIRKQIQKNLYDFYLSQRKILTFKSPLPEDFRENFMDSFVSFFSSIDLIKKNIIDSISQYLQQSQLDLTKMEINERVSIYLIDAVNSLINIEVTNIFKSSFISKKESVSSYIDGIYFKIYKSSLLNDEELCIDSPTIKEKISSIDCPDTSKKIQNLINIYQASSDDELTLHSAQYPCFDEIRGLHLFAAIICHQITLKFSQNKQILDKIKSFFNNRNYSNLLKIYEYQIYDLRNNRIKNQSFMMGSMLCSLIQLDEIVLAKFLIKMNHSLSDRDQLGRTPLHLAVLRKHYDLIDFIKKSSLNKVNISDNFFELLSLKDRPNYKSPIGKTAFDYALTNQDITSINLLFKENLFYPSFLNETNFINPLHRIALIPNFNPSIVTLLHEHSVYLDPKDQDNRASPAMVCYKNHQYDLAKKFIELGCSLTLNDKNNESLIFYALQHIESDELCFEHVNYIIQKLSWYEKIDTYSKNMKTPLMLAIESEKFEVSLLLIENGFSKIITKQGNLVVIDKSTLSEMKNLLKNNKFEEALDLYGSIIDRKMLLPRLLKSLSTARYRFINLFFHPFFSFSHTFQNFRLPSYSSQIRESKRNIKIKFAEQLTQDDDSIDQSPFMSSYQSMSFSLELPTNIRHIVIDHSKENTELDNNSSIAHRQ